MADFDSDPCFVPAPIRIARPLFIAFVHSRHCPPEHRWHARSTLPVLALFLAMTAEHDSSGLSWGSLSPDGMVAASLDADPEELGFLRDLLDVSASFYAFLGDEGLVPLATADRIRHRLATLALGMSRAA